MNERQTNYTIAEGYELPSRGLIYDVPVNPNVELRSMTARDEMKRLSPSRTPLKTLADIIEGCMLEKPAIHVYDMCLGDYEFLLHKLRIVTYGEKYNLSLRCPYCNDLIETDMDLSALSLKEFNLDTFAQLKTITLKKSNKEVELNYQTPRMLDEQDNKIKELKRRANTTAALDFETYVKVLTSIKTIDGRMIAPYELDTLLNTLPALDLQKILNSIDQLNGYIGLENTFFVTCPICNNEIKSFFRFGPEFFRPTNI